MAKSKIVNVDDIIKELEKFINSLNKDPLSTAVAKFKTLSDSLSKIIIKNLNDKQKNDLSVKLTQIINRIGNDLFENIEDFLKNNNDEAKKIIMDWRQSIDKLQGLLQMQSKVNLGAGYSLRDDMFSINRDMLVNLREWNLKTDKDGNPISSSEKKNIDTLSSKIKLQQIAIINELLSVGGSSAHLQNLLKGQWEKALLGKNGINYDVLNKCNKVFKTFSATIGSETKNLDYSISDQILKGFIVKEQPETFEKLIDLLAQQNKDQLEGTKEENREKVVEIVERHVNNLIDKAEQIFDKIRNGKKNEINLKEAQAVNENLKAIRNFKDFGKTVGNFQPELDEKSVLLEGIVRDLPIKKVEIKKSAPPRPSVKPPPKSSLGLSSAQKQPLRAPGKFNKEVSELQEKRKELVKARVELTSLSKQPASKSTQSKIGLLKTKIESLQNYIQAKTKTPAKKNGQAWFGEGKGKKLENK